MALNIASIQRLKKGEYVNVGIRVNLVVHNGLGVGACDRRIKTHTHTHTRTCTHTQPTVMTGVQALLASTSIETAE